ncbi:glycosyl hydrolase family 28 protein [uncultured Propionibacterium sp.]|uniref:glycoside hydrolase family 28 protein n=1 Tax=uncultured Propionibacterium sp. TaxID=218066 RepID=UPI00292DFD38|nr:glycosyl hydrolase family 28 protein [uncultured Propionibacterium sp.]
MSGSTPNERIEAAGTGRDATEQIQQAIDALSASGGGVLTLAAGTHAVSGVELRSDVHLVLAAGALLQAVPAVDLPERTVSVAEESRSAIVYARGADNISISGTGVIDGAAGFYLHGLDGHGYMTHERHRPRVIVLEGCSNVELRGFTIRNAPMWTLHLVASTDCRLRDLTLRNALDVPNTDGIDIDTCSRAQVIGCDIAGEDDSICLKTTAQACPALTRACEDIEIRGCRLRSRSSAVKIGSETHGPIRRVRVSDCEIVESNRAFGIQSRDGGEITDVSVTGLRIDTRLQGPTCWGSAEPVHISSRARLAGNRPGRVDDVRIRDVRGRAEGAIVIVGEAAGDIGAIELSGIDVELVAAEGVMAGTADLRPPVNPLARAGTGMDNAYHVDEGEDRPWGVEEIPGWPVGVFTRMAGRVRQDDVRVARRG